MAGIGISGSASSSKSDTKASGSETTEVSVTRLDEELRKLLEGKAKSILDGPDTSEFSKEQAIADASGIVESVFKQYREEALPQIYQAQGTTGGYNNTSAQLLANDAFSRATVDAAEGILTNIGRYADISDRKTALNQESLQGILAALLQAKEDSLTESEFKTRSTTKSSSFSLSGSLGF